MPEPVRSAGFQPPQARFSYEDGAKTPLRFDPIGQPYIHVPRPFALTDYFLYPLDADGRCLLVEFSHFQSLKGFFSKNLRLPQGRVFTKAQALEWLASKECDPPTWLDSVAANSTIETAMSDAAGMARSPAMMKANANSRMIDYVGRHTESRFWTAKKWAEALGYKSAATIKETTTWKELDNLRSARKAEASLNRAERSVGTRRRR